MRKPSRLATRGTQRISRTSRPGPRPSATEDGDARGGVAGCPTGRPRGPFQKRLFMIVCSASDLLISWRLEPDDASSRTLSCPLSASRTGVKSPSAWGSSERSVGFARPGAVGSRRGRCERRHDSPAIDCRAAGQALAGPTCHVYRLTREGRIPVVKLGRYYRYRPDAIDHFELRGLDERRHRHSPARLEAI